MAFIGRMLSNVASFYKEINSATLTGAIDVVVVEQPDRELVCSPFHVRFGKLGVIRSREKVVDMEINGESVGVQMKLGEGGEAFFVENLDDSEEEDAVPLYLATSPLPSSVNIFEEGMAEILKQKEAAEQEVIDLQAGKLRSIKSEENFFTGVGRSKEELDSQETEKEKEEQLEETKKFLRGETGLKEKTKKLLKRKDRVRSQDSLGNSWGLRRAKSWTGRIEHATELAESRKDRRINRKKLSLAANKLRLLNVRESPTKSDEEKEMTNLQINNQVSVTSYYSTTEGDNQQDAQVQFRLEDLSDVDDSHSHSAEDEHESGSSGREGSINSAKAERPSLLKLAGQRTKGNSPEENDIWSTVDEEDEEATPTSRDFGVQQLSSSLPGKMSEAERDTLMRLAMHPLAPLKFHPFSDTEYTPEGSRENSRPATPSASTARSDTELNRIVYKEEMGQDEPPEWKWGELPDKTPTEENPNPGAVRSPSGVSQAETSGYWGDLWGLGQFMRRTRKVRHDPESEGIYLDDLVKSQEMDPKVAALYFPKSRLSQIEEKAAAGTQTEKEEEILSLEEKNRRSASPLPEVYGSSPHDYGYSSNHSSVAGDQSDFNDVSLSLCGGLCDDGTLNVTEEAFAQHLVQYEQLNKDPSLVFNEKLVVRVQGKYMPWKEAAPVIVSLMAFQQPLSSSAQSSPEKKDSEERSVSPASASTGGVGSWFRWSRSYSADPEKDLAKNVVENLKKSNLLKERNLSGDSTTKPVVSLDDSVVDTSTSGKSSPKTHTVKALELPISLTETTQIDIKVCKKSLRLKSEQLKALKLKPGMNDVRFSVTTKYQGTSYCICHIFLWKWSDRVVISDIDGTITKSDVLGQILPVVGGQWAQAGVTKLFSRIENQGYQFLYLSARAIGQSHWTKEYLTTLKQDEHSLPPGPLMLNPTSLINAFHREVIERNPEEFKKSCLNDVKALFPPSIRNPFVAGFGNKINDVWAYQAVGIPISRIFSINHLGEVRYELTRGFSSTYKKMSTELCDHMFPPVVHPKSLDDLSWTKELKVEEFAGFNFWKKDIAIDVDLERFPSPSNQKLKQTKKEKEKVAEEKKK